MTSAAVWAAAMTTAAELAETFARATEQEARKRNDPQCGFAVAQAMRNMAKVFRADALRPPPDIDDDKTPPTGTIIPREAKRW